MTNIIANISNNHIRTWAKLENKKISSIWFLDDCLGAQQWGSVKRYVVGVNSNKEDKCQYSEYHHGDYYYYRLL